MKKLAIFVEGQTERIFCESILDRLAGTRDIEFVSRRASGGKRHARYFIAINGVLTADSNAEFFILITDCGTDSRVASEVLDQYPTLKKAGYGKIIAIRDLRPIPRNKLKALHKGMENSLKKISIKFHIVIPVIETETWFLAEHSHFSRIHPNLTPPRVLAELQIDIINHDPEVRENPSNDLHNIYSLENLEYRKSEAEVNRTVNALAYLNLYNQLSAKLESLGIFFNALDEFFDS